MAVKPSPIAQDRLKTEYLLDVPPEKKEAVWFIEWAYSQPLLRDVIIHIANEGKRSRIQGHYLKLQGMRKGVSDFFIPIPKNGYHGLWIELKTMDKRKKPTKEQREWLDRMIALGYAGYVAHGWVEAKTLVDTYLS